MIKIFDSGASLFNNNGLGALPDAISCVITEERNGSFELKLEYPTTGIHFSELKLRRIILAKSNPYSNIQAFRIYSISKPLKKIVTVNAAHISYDMSGIPVAPFKFTNATAIQNVLSKIMEKQVVSSPFVLINDGITEKHAFSITKPESLRSLIGDETHSVLSLFGGEVEFDNYTVTFHEHRGTNRGVTIRYGKNLTDITQDENCSDIYTGVYPFWYATSSDSAEADSKGRWVEDEHGEKQWEEYPGGVTVTSETLVELTGSSKIVPAPGTYDFIKILPLDLSSEFDQPPSPQQLLAKAEQYITDNNIGIPKVSITVSFIDLSRMDEYRELALLQKVELCDTVSVIFPELNVTATAICTRTEYDAILDRYISVTLGEATKNISNTIAGQQKSINLKPSETIVQTKISEVAKKISMYQVQASQMITGGLGGYVVVHSSTGGEQPDEILIMDDLDINVASNVWRWNRNGLGFSSNGYSGPYETAITSDGKIVADFILAGNINGAMIESGTILSTSMSQEFKDILENKFISQRTTIEQSFTAADGIVKSEIKKTTDKLAEDNDTMSQQISALQQDVGGIEAAFTTRFTGGINKVKNSSGLNGVSDDWSIDSSGIVSTGVDDTTVSGSYFKINDSYIEQEISVSSGKKYTISVLAKTTTSSSSSITLNIGGSISNIFYETSILDWDIYSKTFEATSDSVIFKASTSGDSLFVADIMLAEGEDKKYWQPGPNEIYTTNVKVDRHGINITNNESNTETIIDNTQFAVKHNNQVVLTVNKDKTILKETEIQNNLRIGNGKFIPVSGGIDFVILD